MSDAKTKPPEDPVETELTRMQRETDLIISKSAILVKEMEALLESGRQLRAAQDALIEQRKKSKKG